MKRDCPRSMFSAVLALQAQGGEEEMFKEMSSSGIVCDPLTQLIVLCEVCGRPSTKECWTCKMPICSFCTLKRHWRVSFLSPPPPRRGTMDLRRDSPP